MESQELKLTESGQSPGPGPREPREPMNRAGSRPRVRHSHAPEKQPSDSAELSDHELASVLTTESPLLELSYNAIIIRTRGGKIVHLNSAAESLYGFKREEVIGRSVHELLHTEYPDGLRSIDRALARSGEWRGDITQYSRDGRRLVIESRQRRMKGTRLSAYILEANRDVTDSRSAEERLRRFGHWQEVVAALGQIALTTNDLDQLMNEVVTRVAETMRADYVELLEFEPLRQSLVLRAGKGWPRGFVGHATVGAGEKSQAGFTALADEPVIVTDLASEKRFNSPSLLLNRGITCGMTIAIRGPSSTYGVLGVHCKALREFTVDDVHFLRAVSNVLAAAIRGQHLDQAHRDSEARVRAIVNTLVDAVVTIDDHGLIDFVNPAAEHMFGYTASEVVGKNVSMLMPTPFRGEHNSYIQNYRTTGQTRIIGVGREVSGMRKDGTIFPMDLSVSELRVSNRRMFTGVIRDVTERRRMEREILEASADEQRRIGQDLHDGLCQQLAGIAFATEVLTQKLTAKDVPEATSLRKIGQMIDQAITQARDLARGLQPVTFEAHGLRSALKALAIKIEAMFRVSCLFVSDGECLVHDNNVATHLFRIAQEAISNAVKHGKARMIILDLSTSGGELRLSIKDDCIGLKKTAGGGRTGLGLRTMDYRARVIGGSLSVQSDERGGTTVLCVVRNPRALTTTPSEKNHAHKKRNRTESKDPDPGRRRSPDRPGTAGGTDQPGA
ncbi:MAG: PAS domain S-box protein [Tepidisphaeraceae bacterium]